MNDGGFIYTVAGGGSSPAGNTANGGLRSYGSMTYAGLKSMIYAGLTAKDPRVKAASEWIRNHYTVEENPGLGQQGLFYYFDTFARTLSVLKVDQFEDAAGQKHDCAKNWPNSCFICNSRTAAGSIRRNAGWKAIRISPLLTRSSRSNIVSRSARAASSVAWCQTKRIATAGGRPWQRNPKPQS